MERRQAARTGGPVVQIVECVLVSGLIDGRSDSISRDERELVFELLAMESSKRAPSQAVRLHLEHPGAG